MLKKNSQFDFLKKEFHFEKESLKDPRRKADSVKRIFYLLITLSWILFAVSVYFLVTAMPQSDNLFSRLMSTKLNYNWNIARLAEFARFNLFLFLISGINILFNLQRLKRKTDSFDYFNAFTGIYALAGMLFYLFMK